VRGQLGARRRLKGADSSPCEATRTTDVPQASPEEFAAAGPDKLPLAPLSERVDLVAPPFSNSTNVTDPLFPISDLHSAILNGKVDRKPFKVETTLLPETRIIDWIEGQCAAIVSQYVAYLNGRIEEVALDFYAQADDGSVWYFVEDVFNYSDGAVADLEGTWLAGKEGPAAMIMPADPTVGNAFLPENIPGLVFEEVTVRVVDETVPGPHGPMGAVLVDEMSLELGPGPAHAGIWWSGIQPGFNDGLQLALRGGEDYVAQEESAFGSHQLFDALQGNDFPQIREVV
jgi:hypothetical protein